MFYLWLRKNIYVRNINQMGTNFLLRKYTKNGYLLLISICPDLLNPLIMSSPKDGSTAKTAGAHNPVRVE